MPPLPPSAGGASNAINMSFYPKMPYDTLRDFAPVILCDKYAKVVKAANLRAE